MSLIPLKDADEVEIAMCMSLRRPRNPERYQRVIEASSARHQAFLQSRQAKEEAKKLAEDRPTLIIDVTERYSLIHEPSSWVECPNVAAPKQKGELLIDEVCKKHGVTLADIHGRRRFRKVVAARNEVMYRLCVELRWSMPAVAKKLKRDHSTVHYGRNRHACENGLPMDWPTNKQDEKTS